MRASTRDMRSSGERISTQRNGGSRRMPLGILRVVTAMSVSYTHLDVYKRQIFGFVDFLAAGVVTAAFHIADAQGAADHFFEKRNIAEEELFLEGLGAGGDDDALFREQGRDQVGEGFARAGAGFDDQFCLLYTSRCV